MAVLFTRAVIDSGVLFTTLTLNYIRRTHFPEPKRTKILNSLDMELRANGERQQAYLLMMSSIGVTLITSHVVGELQGLQTSRLGLRDDDLRFFWLHSLEYLLERNLDERLLRLLDMNSREHSREALCNIGPADTGLIDLALSEGCPLLTDDEHTLAWRAWRAGVDCRVVRQIIVA